MKSKSGIWIHNRLKHPKVKHGLWSWKLFFLCTLFQCILSFVTVNVFSVCILSNHYWQARIHFISMCVQQKYSMNELLFNRFLLTLYIMKGCAPIAQKISRFFVQFCKILFNLEKKICISPIFVPFQSFFPPNLLFGHVFAPGGGGIKQKNIHPCSSNSRCLACAPKIPPKYDRCLNLIVWLVFI